MRNKIVRFNLSHNEREKEFIENKSQKFGFKSILAFLLDSILILAFIRI